MSYNFDYKDLINRLVVRLDSTGRVIDTKNLFFLLEDSYTMMKHAFSKYDQSFKLGVNFEDVFDVVLDFTMPLYMYLNGSDVKYTAWDKELGRWY